MQPFHVWLKVKPLGAERSYWQQAAYRTEA
jgi:hypothetical protein